MSLSTTPEKKPGLQLRDLLKSNLLKFSGTSKVKATVQAGEPLFNQKDIYKTVNPIARLARMVLVDRSITKNELLDLHNEYERNEGKHPKDINTSRNNLFRTLDKPRMTVKIFERLLTFLGFRILDVAYTLQDIDTGEIKEYRLSDSYKMEMEMENEHKFK